MLSQWPEWGGKLPLGCGRQTNEKRTTAAAQLSRRNDIEIGCEGIEQCKELGSRGSVAVNSDQTSHRCICERNAMGQQLVEGGFTQM